MSVAPFASVADLEARFAHGLARMLAEHRGLGVYILVLANALQSDALWQRLGADLAVRHADLGDALARALRRGEPSREPEDDQLVFLKLLAMGFSSLAPAETRRVEAADGDAGPAWELQFNPLRALRPARMSQARVEGIQRPFEADGFHFNKPFLAKEVFWEGELAGKSARLLYNKFPFAPLHGLLVPEPDRRLPQFLTPEFHAWAWSVAAAARAATPGLCLAYNSYGALASVNHLHFQSFVRQAPLPAQAEPLGAYPLVRHFHDDAEAAWFHLDDLHCRGRAYNLLYADGGLLIIERARQGETPPETWSPGFAWSEVAGAFPVASRAEFEELDHPRIADALARLRP